MLARGGVEGVSGRRYHERAHVVYGTVGHASLILDLAEGLLYLLGWIDGHDDQRVLAFVLCK